MRLDSKSESRSTNCSLRIVLRALLQVWTSTTPLYILRTRRKQRSGLRLTGPICHHCDSPKRRWKQWWFLHHDIGLEKWSMIHKLIFADGSKGIGPRVGTRQSPLHTQNQAQRPGLRLTGPICHHCDSLKRHTEMMFFAPWYWTRKVSHDL